MLTRLKTAGLRKILRISLFLLRGGYRSFRVARIAITNHGAVQRTWEIMNLVREVERLRPMRIMEIGTKEGGTLFCWAQVLLGQARLISVDLPGGNFGGGYGEDDIKRFEGFLQRDQRLECLRQDSHLNETLHAIRARLAGNFLDFLFIDGDHTYAGVKADFEMYAPLVRSGGLIAFHDILNNPKMPDSQVHHFWNEVKHRYAHREFIDDARTEQQGMGIGVLTYSTG